MNPQTASFQTGPAHWAAVFSLFMGVTSLIAAEFIPVSLLTLISADLSITEGMAGQTVTAVGIFAVFTSLLLSPLTQRTDRRMVLLTLSLLLILSNLLVGLAPNYPILLIGRGMLGICVGGFWSMASAVTLQLVPTKDVPRALSIVYAGVSVATILSLPLASYLGQLLGWRNVFLLAAGLGGIAFIWQFFTLPSIPAQPGSAFRNMIGLFRETWILSGMGATIFSYGGYHIFFTYLRPFLEQNLALAPDSLAGMLLLFGVMNCLGTFCAGMILSRHFRAVLIGIHVALAATAGFLFLKLGQIPGSMVLVLIWGFIFGFIPVSWSTWITRTLADRAELAGGISVAAIQFSIGLAAAAGGLTFDTLGMDGIFLAAMGFLSLAALLAGASLSLHSKKTGPQA